LLVEVVEDVMLAVGEEQVGLFTMLQLLLLQILVLM
jgi:hypothetical protein